MSGRGGDESVIQSVSGTQLCGKIRSSNPTHAPGAFGEPQK